jgi:hypothetical protein
MRSLRLDDDLDDLVRRAASVEGCSVSEFLRQAAAERADRAISELPPSERLADFIGAISHGGLRARDSSRVFAEMLAEDHARKSRR